MHFRNALFQQFLLTNTISAGTEEASGKQLESFTGKGFSAGDDSLGLQRRDSGPEGGDHDRLCDPGHALLLLLAPPSCTYFPVWCRKGWVKAGLRGHLLG